MPSWPAALSTAFMVQPSNTAFSPTARARRRRSCSRGLGSSIALNWAAPAAFASPAAGSRTSTSAAAMATAPMMSTQRQPLAIREPADDGRDCRLGEKGKADDHRRQGADRIDQQALAEHLARQSEDQQRRPVVRPDPLAGGSADDEQRRDREQRDKQQAAASAEAPSGPARRRSGSRRKTGRRAGSAYRRRSSSARVRNCCSSGELRRRLPARERRLAAWLASAGRATSRRSRTRSCRCCRTGSHCRAWSFGCRRSSWRGRARRRSRRPGP